MNAEAMLASIAVMFGELSSASWKRQPVSLPQFNQTQISQAEATAIAAAEAKRKRRQEKRRSQQ